MTMVRLTTYQLHTVIHITARTRYFLVALACLLGIVLLLSAPSRHLMHKYKLLPEHESYAELYFADPNAVPKTYKPGSSQPVAFTVHNVSDQTRTYMYGITFAAADDDQPAVLQRSQITLKPHASTTITRSLQLPDAGQHAVLQVTLPEQTNTLIQLRLERT